jgi:hypothetical protein
MIPYKNYKVIEDSAGKKGHFINKNKRNKNLAVFVHGFTGNYLSTWGALPDLLTSDPRLLHFDFLFWGYSSNFIVPKEEFVTDNIKQLFTQFLSKHKTNQHIDVVAQGLQTELKYLEEYDNIVLIGHSLGGLVIRSYIIQNLREMKKDNLERINKINQIILFGTPNEGLDVANNKLLGKLNNQIYDMGSYNEFTNTLREEWVELVFKNRDLTFSTLMVAGEDDYFVPFEQVTKYFRDSRELTKGDHISMVKPTSIHDTSYKIIANNLLKIMHKNIFELKDTYNAQQSYKPSIQLELLEKIRKLIAERGLDDVNWSKAVSSQYFLINLARLLNLTKNSDYKNLLDLFLQSFYMKVDNSIVLSEDKILVTPEETRRLKKCMLEEDEKDNYYSRYSKLAAKNLDAELLQDNYHYGLMVQISRLDDFQNSSTLKIIQELAINRLIYGNGKNPTDDHGGWYPQRIPWVTARILISLKNSGFENRSDNEYIIEVTSQALDYLIRTIYKDSYWRSGVGEWVTNWESTALCLEALQDWGKVKENKSKIVPIIKYLLANEKEWLVPPSFESEISSNATLASVTLLCNLLGIIHSNFKENFKIDYNKYIVYLSNVFDCMVNSQSLKVRQYNTMPQIAFYVTRLILMFSQATKPLERNHNSSPSIATFLT